jgi:hypothetical protein
MYVNRIFRLEQPSGVSIIKGELGIDAETTKRLRLVRIVHLYLRSKPESTSVLRNSQRDEQNKDHYQQNQPVI